MTAPPSRPPAPRPPLVRRLVAWLPTAYKRWLSPWLPRACRYSPTCSEYARLAVLRHGAGKGSLLAVRRLLSCQPLSAGGIDLP